MKVGIFGVGVVGSAILETIKPACSTVVYDKFRHGYNDLSGVLSTEILFLCVPTPMQADGTQDLSALHDALGILAERQYGGFVISKSTTLPGTIRQAAKRYDLKLVHSPEFLTERNAREDFARQRIHLFAGPKEAQFFVQTLMTQLHPENRVVWYDDPTTTELVKYLHNCMLATKVALCNEFYDACEAMGVKYEDVRRGAVAIGQIGETHTIVPGPDGKTGFGGMCFPKDTSAFLAWAEEMGLSAPVMRGVVDGNKERRPEQYESRPAPDGRKLVGGRKR